MDNFVSPHVHLQSLDTGSKISDFIKRELELGTGYLTCTDHGSLGAARQVYDLAKKAKLKPIIGCEFYHRDENDSILIAAGIPKTIAEVVDGEAPKVPTFIEYQKYRHLTAHFMDEQAFQVASKVLSKAALTKAEKHGSELKPIFDWADIEELAGANTTFGSGCLIGMVQRHLMNNRPDIARSYYERYRSIVRPGNFYVEVFPHRCDRNWVQAVFLFNEAGEKLRFHPKKTLRIVDSSGKITEGHSQDLFKKYQKEAKIYTLVAVSHYRVWQDREPFRIARWEYVEDYVKNECTPTAPEGDPQIGGNRFMLAMAKEYSDPVICSDDSHFAYPEDKVVQDVRLGQGGAWKFANSYHRQNSDEAFAYFQEVFGTKQVEFETWVQNSKDWASRFNDFKFTPRQSLPTKFYPANTLAHTMELIKQHGRMDWKNKAYVDRLRAEIKLLHKNGVIDLLPYMMLDEEVCSLYEKNNQLTGPGRGSAAGLIITYLLGITHVDPLKYNLSMDRFLTPDRIQSGKLPDVDQDLCNRDLLVGPNGEGGWLKERFGDHYAQISTDTSMKVKSSIKDVHRAMHGEVPGEIHQICSKIPDPPQGVSDKDFVFGYATNEEDRVPGILETEKVLQEYVAKYPQEWATVVKCLGLVRNRSRHACGFLISQYPVAEFIPLMNIGGTTCTSYTAPSVEAAGGLKMDFLVVNCLNDIAACIRMIQERYGQTRGFEGGPEYLGHDFTLNGLKVPGLRVVPHTDGQLYDIWALPEDQSVFRMICEQDTESVFQFGSPGAMKWLKHFNHEKKDQPGHKAIDSIEGLAAFTALDRPGPLDAYVGEGNNKWNMLVEFAIRAQGGKPTGNLQVLDEMLPETKGVICYQEQVQKVFQVIAGTDGIVANSFREHVAKKKKAEVIKDYAIFYPAASAKYGPELASKIWGMLETFAAYGFVKSHAVAYTYIGYACAFLKKHYPLEWWCAVLRNADRNEINEKFWRHCGAMLELPDIKYSGDQFEIQGTKIRAPLSLLQGIGPGAHQELCEERPYKDVEELCQKLEARKERLGTPYTKTVEKKKTDRKTKEVTTTTTEVPAIKKARSAVTAGTMAKLIVSGTADGLFPPEFTLLDKLAAYEMAKAKAQNKLRKDGSVKAEPVASKYLDINQFQRYQMRKALLPGFGSSLLPMFLERKVPRVKYTNGRWLFETTYKRNNQVFPITVPFTGAKGVQALDKLTILPQEQTIALAAYIAGYRPFNYQGGKEAVEILLDVAGTQLKFVKWCDKKTEKVPPEFKGKLEGALVVVTVNKWQVGRDATLKEMLVVQEPLEQDKPDEEEDKGAVHTDAESDPNQFAS